MNAEHIFDTIAAWYVNSPSLVFKIILSVVILLAMWVIRRILYHIIRERVESVKAIYAWKKGVSYAGWAVCILLIVPIWVTRIHSLATVLGIITAGVAIALKDVIGNVAAWAYILFDRPFRIGDRVEIDGVKGDVIDIAVFKFSILEVGNWVTADQSTGRVIHVPNMTVFGKTLANFNSGFDYIWNEIPILLTYESNWRKAKTLFEDLLKTYSEKNQEKIEKQFRRAKRESLIHYRNITPVVYTAGRESGIELSLRYLCDPRSRRNTEQEIWEQVLDLIDAHDDIDGAYPTMRLVKD